MQNNVGSEWNIWDLHIHTASSYDYKYKAADADDILCEQLKNHGIKAVAITDHWKIDKNRIISLRQKAPDIVFFPGVELRTDKGSNNLHVILIFSETMNLDVLIGDFEAIMLRKKAKSSDSDETIYWSFDDIVEFAKNHDALISIHAGRKTNGIDKEINNSLPVKEAIKADIAESIHFFEIGQKRDIDSYENYVFKEIARKPLIMCSDNHFPQEYATKEKLWIKADLTFTGLKQCLYQPQERVFIGDIPPVLERLEKNSQNNIKSVTVKQIKSPANSEKKWFDFELPINPGMAAIIGSKGSGKSAFSDIVGALCKCNTMSSASFLNERRFRKAPQNYAKDYEAEIVWADGKTYNQNLGETDNSSVIEYAQYLPQKHIEDICNDFGEAFQQEIDKVIFSYVDETVRGDAHSLEELVQSKASPLQIKKEDFLSKLHSVNKKIIELEKKKKVSYKKSVEDNLANAKELLERQEKNKPVEVKKPEPKDTDTKYQEHLESLSKQISELGDEKKKAIDEITKINAFVDDANSIIASIEVLQEQYGSITNTIVSFNGKYDLSLTVPEFNLSSIRLELSKTIRLKEASKEKLQNSIASDDIGFDAQIEKLKTEKESLISEMDSEEKQYQKYLSDLSEWENTKNKIIGNSTIDGSIGYYEHELQYLTESIENEYALALRKRDEITKSIYQCTVSCMNIYKEIYEPIQGEISRLLGDLEDGIAFQAEISLKDVELSQKIVDHINLRYNGKFGRGHNSIQEVDALLHATDFASEDSIISFVHQISQTVTDDLESAEKRIPNIEAFYDLIFGLEYINVNFRLKMGERNLEELSPGERGIVLLIFYLALSKESKPIIIDQPEDNLDNQSVYSKLVPCICRAKQRRQVIIVTHNPNIAVACDAEQIVFCNMDKHNSHIDYVSGSIENPEMKKHVIDVLEGTMPAFDLRRKKYD